MGLVCFAQFAQCSGRRRFAERNYEQATFYSRYQPIARYRRSSSLPRPLVPVLRFTGIGVLEIRGANLGWANALENEDSGAMAAWRPVRRTPRVGGIAPIVPQRYQKYSKGSVPQNFRQIAPRRTGNCRDFVNPSIDRGRRQAKCFLIASATSP